jgi:hypothetical protein
LTENIHEKIEGATEFDLDKFDLDEFDLDKSAIPQKIKALPSSKPAHYCLFSIKPVAFVK